MKLTRIERIILINQFEVLLNLDKRSGRDYDQYIKALRCGYELEYENIESLIYPDDEGLSEGGCKEVIDILDMYRQIEFKTDKSVKDINKYELFNGFDGNNEGSQYGYCKYIIDDCGKFKELKKYPRNSHSRRLDEYRKKLYVWRKMPNMFDLTAEEAESVLTAR